MVRLLETPVLENILKKPKLTPSTTPQEKEKYCPDGKDSSDILKLDVQQQRELINKIGDSKCKSQLQDALTTFVDSQRRGGISMYGAAAQIDQSAFKNHVTNSGASGCLQALIQSNTALNVMNSLTCNATFSKNESGISITDNTNITIRTIKTEEDGQRQDAAYARHDANITRLLANPNQYTAELLKELNAGFSEEIKSFDYGLYNAKIIMTAEHKANIESTSTSTIQDETSAVEDLKTLVKTATAAEIKEKTGYGAMPGSSSLTSIEQKVQNLAQSELVKVVSSVNQTNYSRDSTGGIVLEIAGPIRDLDIQSHQGDLIGFKTTMMMSEAQKIGKRLANEFINEAKLSLTRTTEQSGLDDYDREINKGITDSIDAQNKGGDLFGGMGLMLLLPIIGLLIVGYLVYKFMFGGIIGTGIKIALIVAVVVAIYLAVAYFVGLFPFSSKKEKSEIILPNKWLRPLTMSDINKIIEPIGIKKIKQDVKKNLLDLFIYQKTNTKEEYLNSLSTKPERVSMAIFIEGWNNGSNSFEFMKNYLAMPFDMHKDKVFSGDLEKYPQWALDIADKEELKWDSTNIRNVVKFVDANIKSVFSQKDNRKRKTNYGGRGSSNLEYRNKYKKPYQE